MDRKDDAINALSALMTSCFSLGQMIGPLLGSFLAARTGFRWASTLLALALIAHTAVLCYMQRLSRPHQVGSVCGTLTGQNSHSAPDGAESELAALNLDADGDGHDRPLSASDAGTGEEGGMPSSEAARLQRKWQT